MKGINSILSSLFKDMIKKTTIESRKNMNIYTYILLSVEIEN